MSCVGEEGKLLVKGELSNSCQFGALRGGPLGRRSSAITIPKSSLAPVGDSEMALGKPGANPSQCRHYF